MEGVSCHEAINITDRRCEKAPIIGISAFCNSLWPGRYAPVYPAEGSIFSDRGQGVAPVGDGVSIAGVLVLLCTGGFWLDRKGILDFAAYALYQARYLLSRKRSTQERLTNYSDFKQLRQHGTKPLWPWASVGIAFLATGVLLAVAYVA